MKKYSREWKLKNKEWLQKHADGLYRHYIAYGTEYSRRVGGKKAKYSDYGANRSGLYQ